MILVYRFVYRHCQTHAHADAQVKYASLPNYEEKEEDFRAESVLLRRRFTEEGKESLHFILAL